MALVLEGTVVPGFRHGAVFVQRYLDKLEDACGFKPFLGTLNLECSMQPEFPVYSNFIPGWTERGAEYGSVWCYPCSLNGLKGAVIVPDKTSHPPEVIEVISSYCLKTRLGLKRGSTVKLEVLPVRR
ncbi:CTP-dependent riboflavin kinase [archaeon]|nr:CTP-dependent riboflavin kinase [archaeon]